MVSSVLRSLREHKNAKRELTRHGPCGSPDATAPGLVQGLRYQARGGIEQLVLAGCPWQRQVMHMLANVESFTGCYRSRRSVILRAPLDP